MSLFLFVSFFDTLIAKFQTNLLIFCYRLITNNLNISLYFLRIFIYIDDIHGLYHILREYEILLKKISFLDRNSIDYV